MVCRFFARRGESSEESRDLAQETFLRVYESLDRFRGDADPQTWIWTIAGNVHRNHIRRARSQKRYGTEISLEESSDLEARVPDTAPAPEQTIILSERRATIHRALFDLPPRYQAALRLFYLHDHTLAELLRQTGHSQTALKSLLYRARHALMERLSDLDHPPTDAGAALEHLRDRRGGSRRKV